LNAPIVDFSEFDPTRKILDREGIEKFNPHRFELSLLDGILFEDFEVNVRAVGIHHVRNDEFWVRGHFPNFPLMPGVVVCECAAQLCAYVASRSRVYIQGLMALGGLDEVRFRGPVKPGDELIIMLNRTKFRANIMIISQFQCYVNRNIVAEGTIRGAVLNP
jgi:3-hydroxyacyl-[acyl-carrier-protein] dehydratase